MMTGMTHSHTFRIAILLLAGVGDLPGDIHARELGSEWSVEVPLTIGMHTMVSSDGRDAVRLRSLSVDTGLELSPYHRRWSAGLFVEHHLGDASDFGGMTHAGTFATWNAANWDMSTALMFSKTSGAAGVLHYASRLRRDLTDRQRLSILAGVPVHDPAATTVALGWDTAIGMRLMLKLSAAAAIADPARRSLGVAVTWQIF